MPEKATPLAFKFPLALLQTEGGYLLQAAARHPEIVARLGAPFFVTARGNFKALFGLDANADPAAPDDGAPSAVGAPLAKESFRAGLTIERNTALDAVEELMTQARKTARRAFKGQTVKLHDDYQIGLHDSRTLGDVLARASLIADACARDAAAMAAKGWSVAETTRLRDTIPRAGNPDAAQVAALSGQKDATDARNVLANEFYEACLTIENAADIQWPASVGGNVGVRGEFRLGSFPPRLPKKAAAPAGAVPPPAA